MFKNQLDETEVMRMFVGWLKDNDEEDECGEKAGDRVAPHYGYRGRGMNGQRCFGLEGRVPDVLDAMLGFAVANPHTLEIVRRIIKGHRQDNMGMGMIVYFPGVDLPQEEE
jgi:hypothetical protein